MTPLSAITAYLAPLAVLMIIAAGIWALATVRRNVGIVDVFWSQFILIVILFHALHQSAPSARCAVVLVLGMAWSIRLSVHLARRTWNEPEERRYREIRERNEPGYAWKSLYLVFGLQALLAWIVALPVAASARSHAAFGWLDIVGTSIVLLGIVLESVADRQLVRFKADVRNRGRVLDSGLWRYSRHPNYFGECCIWWGFYLVACSAGAAWTIASPVLMTLLLLRISGIPLLEQGIEERRPGYHRYASRTNAFVPWPAKSG